MKSSRREFLFSLLAARLFGADPYRKGLWKDPLYLRFVLLLFPRIQPSEGRAHFQELLKRISEPEARECVESEITADDRFEAKLQNLDADTVCAIGKNVYPPAKEFFGYAQEPSGQGAKRISQMVDSVVSSLENFLNSDSAILSSEFPGVLARLPGVRVDLRPGKPLLGSVGGGKPAIIMTTALLRAAVDASSRVALESNLDASDANTPHYLDYGYLLVLMAYAALTSDQKAAAEIGDDDLFQKLHRLHEAAFGRALRFLFLHELGHFAFRHHASLDESCVTFQAQELQADEYAGFALRLMAGDSDDDSSNPIFLDRIDSSGFRPTFGVVFRLAGFLQNGRSQECAYPSLEERLASAQKGWDRAQESLRSRQSKTGRASK